MGAVQTHAVWVARVTDPLGTTTTLYGCLICHAYTQAVIETPRPRQRKKIYEKLDQKIAETIGNTGCPATLLVYPYIY